MPWTSQGGGGGPWGSGGGGQGPWGRPGGGGTPPDLEELLRKGQESFKKVLPGGSGGRRGLVLVGLAVVALWLASGFFRVDPREQGVVLRFGEWVRTTEPGLHYHLPTPIETVLTPQVTQINRVEIGYRSPVEGVRGSGRDVPEESLMVTGDENIVDADFTVLWKISDAGKYLFNIQDPEGTLKVAAESSIREIIGQTPIQLIFTEERARIQQRARELLQSIMESYGSGIEVLEVQIQRADPPATVIDAFNDVQRAKQDQSRLRNEADAYARDIVPRARGEARRLIEEARASRERMINEANGEAQRFLSVLAAYKQAPDITERRLYIDTMEQVLRGTSKVILDTRGQSAQGVLPYLPLPELNRRTPPQGGAAAPTANEGGKQ